MPEEHVPGVRAHSATAGPGGVDAAVGFIDGETGEDGESRHEVGPSGPSLQGGAGSEETSSAPFRGTFPRGEGKGDGDGQSQRGAGVRLQPRTMDWEQDAPLIFPAVNRVAGFEVRAAKHLHWWTFLGYLMEIRDSTFATILALRQKKARGKKLEKEEAEFWRRNAGVCELKKRLTAAERAEKRRLERMMR